MSCPSGTISHGQVAGESGCSMSVACDIPGRPRHYVQIYDKCYTYSGAFAGDYYSFTDWQYCC